MFSQVRSSFFAISLFSLCVCCAHVSILYPWIPDLGYSKQEAANLVKGYRSGKSFSTACSEGKVEHSMHTFFYALS